MGPLSPSFPGGEEWKGVCFRDRGQCLGHRKGPFEADPVLNSQINNKLLLETQNFLLWGRTRLDTSICLFCRKPIRL